MRVSEDGEPLADQASIAYPLGRRRQPYEVRRSEVPGRLVEPADGPPKRRTATRDGIAHAYRPSVQFRLFALLRLCQHPEFEEGRVLVVREAVGGRTGHDHVRDVRREALEPARGVGSIVR